MKFRSARKVSRNFVAKGDNNSLVALDHLAGGANESMQGVYI